MGSLHSVCPHAQNYECSLWGNAAAPHTGFEFQITFQELQLLQGALVKVGWKVLARFRRLLVSCINLCHLKIPELRFLSYIFLSFL